MAQTLMITGIALGILMNLIALAGLIWKLGSWNGRVTTLLEEHAKDHENHYTTAGQHGERIATLEGMIE